MTLFIEGRILPIAYLRVTDLTQPIILAGFSPFAGGQMLTQSTNIVWQMVTQSQTYLRIDNRQLVDMNCLFLIMKRYCKVNFK